VTSCSGSPGRAEQTLDIRLGRTGIAQSFYSLRGELQLNTQLTTGERREFAPERFFDPSYQAYDLFLSGLVLGSARRDCPHIVVAFHPSPC
jgi:hypothetical protein